MMKVIAIIIYFYIVTFMAFPVGSWSVIGGNSAAPGQFPFIISLRSGPNAHTCGGSIIDRNWVITAAQCVTEYVPMGYSIVAGTTLLSSNNEVKTRVLQTIIHPNFNQNLLINDIALLRLASPLNLSDLIQPIDLGCEENVEKVQNCTMAGWGSTSTSNDENSDNLQFANLETLPNSECKRIWAHGRQSYPVLESEICTVTEGGKGACYGDAGGPLIARNNGKITLIGIDSWGSPCALGWPDVYTRVSSFCPWIKNVIQN